MTTYKEAGVDIEKKNELLKKIKGHIKSTHDGRVISSETLFKGLVVSAEELKKYKAPVLAFNTDGVGTKTLIAAELNRWEGIGEDIVNHCINDILSMGAKPLCFSDYIASSKLDNAVVERIVKSIANCCKKEGIIFAGGETAEMPDVYHEKAIDVVGFILGAVEKEKVIEGSAIKEGDELIGISSSGLHSNGYSLVRAILRTGKLKLSDRTGTESAGEMLLKPHRNYLNTTLTLMERYRIKGIAHITGGSFRKNLPRILPKGLGAEIKKENWEPLPIFRLIQQRGNVPEEEMYNTFNMGIGYVYVVDKKDADDILQQLQQLKEKAYLIGSITSREGVHYASN
ncbi:phosphoribosylformylglycinamidine cyclo-ligase [Candidatus Woesearchaeota archaeon]|nr:phosphoribosylformylglycinamidine cyclo-ligase [Candidatus Woesearchaeota archaeon]